MLLASCLDASGDPDQLKCHVSMCLNLGIPELKGEFDIRTKQVWRGGMGSIAGMHVDVISRYNDEPAPVPKQKNEKGNENHHDHSHSHGHGHQCGHQHHSADVEPKLGNNTSKDQGSDSESHSHAYDHSHFHSHSHQNSHSPSNSIGPLRNLTEIRRLLEESDKTYIAPWVRKMAILTFTELAIAEATTHGASGTDAVHFHEVGAVDSIVDTVGTLIALHYLGAVSFSCSRIPIGEGTVWTNHGILPVPAPATLRLLMGMPTCPGPKGVVTGELVTPTGAALLRALCLVGDEKSSGDDGANDGEVLQIKTNRLEPTGRPPAFTIRKIGIGAGTRDFEKHPNILRLLIGDDVVTKK